MHQSRSARLGHNVQQNPGLRQSSRLAIDPNMQVTQSGLRHLKGHSQGSCAAALFTRHNRSPKGMQKLFPGQLSWCCYGNVSEVPPRQLRATGLSKMRPCFSLELIRTQASTERVKKVGFIDQLLEMQKLKWAYANRHAPVPPMQMLLTPAQSKQVTAGGNIM